MNTKSTLGVPDRIRSRSYSEPPNLAHSQDTLMDILKDGVKLDKFRTFTREIHSEEHLLFWCEVEDYKKLTDFELMVSAAEKILDRYLQPGAKAMLNLDDEQSFEELEEKISALHSCPLSTAQSIFDEAQSAVYFLMASDTFPRYKRYNQKEGRKKGSTIDGSTSEAATKVVSEDWTPKKSPAIKVSSHGQSSGVRGHSGSGGSFKLRFFSRIKRTISSGAT